MAANKTEPNNSNKLSHINIGFIGGGNMAQALIGGLLENGVAASAIMVSDPSETVQATLGKKNITVTTDNEAILAFADVVVLAIKPQLFETVLSPLQGKLSQQLILSVAAGMPVARIASLLGSNNIIRAMPNTPALIQAGATGLFAGEHIDATHKAVAEQILAATGLVVWVTQEEQMHAVTAVSGSAPAYFFYFIEAMIAAAVKQGLTAEQAKSLALQTAFGAASMALNSDDEPAELRRKVTSPKGTTHAAITHMQQEQLAEKIADAMQACINRSEEMATQM